MCIVQSVDRPGPGRATKTRGVLRGVMDGGWQLVRGWYMTTWGWGPRHEAWHGWRSHGHHTRRWRSSHHHVGRRHTHTCNDTTYAHHALHHTTPTEMNTKWYQAVSSIGSRNVPGGRWGGPPIMGGGGSARGTIIGPVDGPRLK